MLSISYAADGHLGTNLWIVDEIEATNITATNITTENLTATGTITQGGNDVLDTTDNTTMASYVNAQDTTYNSSIYSDTYIMKQGSTWTGSQNASGYYLQEYGIKNCDYIICHTTDTGCDYVCDDNNCTVEYQAAIDAANSKGGGNVCVRYATYVMNGTLYPKNNVSLISNRAILKVADNTEMTKLFDDDINVVLNDWTMKGFELDGNKDNQVNSVRMMIMYRPFKVEMSDLYIHDFNNSGITWFYGTVGGVYFNGNNLIKDVTVEDTNGDGFSITQVTHSTFDNLKAINCSTSGFRHTAGGGGAWDSYNTFINTKAIDTRYPGSGYDFIDCRHTTVINAEAIRGGSIGFEFGKNMDYLYVDGLKAINNTRGIGILTSSANKKRIYNLYAEGNTQEGIVLGNMNNSLIDGIISINNTEYGVEILNNNDMTISNIQSIDNGYSGIDFYNNKNTVSNNFLLKNNNRVSGNYYGMRIDGASGSVSEYNTFDGITVIDDQAIPTQKYGIYFDNYEYNNSIFRLVTKGNTHGHFNGQDDSDYIERIENGVKKITGTIDTEEYYYDISQDQKVLGMNFNNVNTLSNDIFDSSTENNHGVNNGATYLYSGGFNNGSAYDFDGDYISISDSSSLDLTTAFTISFYANEKTYATNAGLINKYLGTGNKRAYVIATIGSNEIYVTLSSDGTTTDQVITTQNCGLYNGIGRLITITYNSTHLVFYTDGSHCETRATSISSINPNDRPLFIGYNEHNAVYFNGTIDEVNIWNSTFSAEKVEQIYRQRMESPNSFVSQKHIKVNSTAIYPQNDFVMIGYNITWHSADGTVGCCGMNNDLSFSCSAGAC